MWVKGSIFGAWALHKFLKHVSSYFLLASLNTTRSNAFDAYKQQIEIQKQLIHFKFIGDSLQVYYKSLTSYYSYSGWLQLDVLMNAKRRKSAY